MKNTLSQDIINSINYDLKLKIDCLSTEFYGKINQIIQEGSKKIEDHVNLQIQEIENIQNIKDWGEIKSISDVLYAYFHDSDINKEFAIMKMHYWIQNYKKENEELTNEIKKLRANEIQMKENEIINSEDLYKGN
jgi:ribosomal protein S13